MKKQLFTFVMMLALVIFAGSAFAGPGAKNMPYPGGTYSYTLTGIKTNSAGTAAISYSGTNVTIQNVMGAGALVPYSTPVATVANTSLDLTFDIKYADGATDGKITVTVTDGAGGCVNFIEYNIDVQPLPTLALALSVSNYTACQNTKASPLADNENASIGAAQNTFTYTVTPTITNDPVAYTYTYEITLPLAQSLTNYAIAYTGPGTLSAINGSTGVATVTGADAETAATFVVTFDTTTGLAPITQTATLTTNTPKLTATNGGAVYNGTITGGAGSKTVTVRPMPTIGSFQ